WQFGEPRHELEPFGAQSLQLADAYQVPLALRHGNVGERHGVEVVIRQSDEAQAAAAELDDLVHDRIDLSLTRLLFVRPPDRTERAVLRTAAHGLDGSPPVPALGQQLPSGRDEAIGID